MLRENFCPRTESQYRALRILMGLILACPAGALLLSPQTSSHSSDALPPTSPCAAALRPKTPCAAANQEAVRLLTARKLPGIVMMQDVPTGRVIVLAGTGENPGGEGVHPAGVLAEAGFLPLSTVKLMLAASWFDHQESIDDPKLRKTESDIQEMLVEGHDAPARQLALLLRRTVGSEAVLADLARFGFPPCAKGQAPQPFSPPACVALSATSSDEEWASALSIGESSLTVSILQLSNFLRAVGKEGALSMSSIVQYRPPGNRMGRETAIQLQINMLQAVEQGTAKGIYGRLGKQWEIGGKTGTGPGTAHPYDGIFAGLVFDEERRVRYTLVCYARRSGPGGGAAAEISADLARFVLGL
jgi:Penicillin binding protein transpeptidase domain